MPSRLWSKQNKQYILFGTSFDMPSNSSRPMVLLFDIGGVCVSLLNNVTSSVRLVC